MTKTRNGQGHDVVSVEGFYPGQRIKVYVMEVKDTPRGPRIMMAGMIR